MRVLVTREIIRVSRGFQLPSQLGATLSSPVDMVRLEPRITTKYGPSTIRIALEPEKRGSLIVEQTNSLRPPRTLRFWVIARDLRLGLHLPTMRNLRVPKGQNE